MQKAIRAIYLLTFFVLHDKWYLFVKQMTKPGKNGLKFTK